MVPVVLSMATPPATFTVPVPAAVAPGERAGPTHDCLGHVEKVRVAAQRGAVVSVGAGASEWPNELMLALPHVVPTSHENGFCCGPPYGST